MKARAGINRKLPLLLLILCVAILAAGCDTPSQERKNAENEERGKKNAVAYIEKKYGFTPTVKSAVIDRIPGGYGGTATTDVIVTMEYGDRVFTVFINGASETDRGSDDYQAEEITAALRTAIDERMPGLQMLTVYPYNRVETIDYSMTLLFQTKYDGSNLKTVLAEGLSGFDAGYLDLDLDDPGQFAFADDILVTKTHEVCFVSLRGGDYLGDPSGYAKGSSACCDGYINLSTGIRYRYERINVGGGLCYCIMPDLQGNTVEETVLEAEYGDLDDYARRKNCVVTPLSKCFEVSVDAYCSRMELYFPISTLAAAGIDYTSAEDVKNLRVVQWLEYGDGHTDTISTTVPAYRNGFLSATISVPADCVVKFGVLEVRNAN